VPHDADPNALAPLVPVFLSYLLSYIFIGIYWNNTTTCFMRSIT